MAKIKMYKKEYCPYCTKAMNLLNKKNVEYEVIDVTHDPALQEEMFKVAVGRTVPQIVINGRSIGGCDDLYALEAEGKLDELLQ
ncbi:MAG: glutaredoxin 3 [Nitrospinae bacterium]|nr:glutaredoxin 3 [Nitrospinota bacterium]